MSAIFRKIYGPARAGFTSFLLNFAAGMVALRSIETVGAWYSLAGLCAVSLLLGAALAFLFGRKCTDPISIGSFCAGVAIWYPFVMVAFAFPMVSMPFMLAAFSMAGAFLTRYVR